MRAALLKAETRNLIVNIARNLGRREGNIPTRVKGSIPTSGNIRSFVQNIPAGLNGQLIAR